MTYCLEYMPKALKNWEKLDITIKKPEDLFVHSDVNSSIGFKM